MTASEKLRALHANWKTSGEHGVGTTYVVCDQLPLIADVVEAAESVTFFGQEAHRFNEWHGSRLVLSLTALRDSLEGGE